MSCGTVKKILFALGLSCILESCAVLRELVGLGPTPPRVSLTSVHVRNLTLNSIDITGSFAVTNPNSFAIEFSSLRYKLDILHRTIASGTYEKTITIPEHATIGVDLPFNVSLGDVLYVAKAYLANTKDMVGEVSALAAFHTPVGAIDVTFKDSKKIQ